MNFPSLEHVRKVASEISSGYDGLGGLRAFEPAPEGAPGFAVRPRVVSLGHNFSPCLALRRMGLMPLTNVYPFDSACTRIAGVLRFLRSDFEGFLDKDALKEVRWGDEAALQSAYCGTDHSFWYENPFDEAAASQYAAHFNRFRTLDASLSPILFVRVAACEEELLHAEDLLSELTARVGAHSMLLFVVDFQQAVRGPATVEGQDRLLLYFLARDEASYSSTEGVAKAYSTPVMTALSWLAGEPLAAIPFPDIAHAAAVCDQDSAGLCGLGDLYAFLELDERPDSKPDNLPAAQTDEEQAPNA